MAKREKTFFENYAANEKILMDITPALPVKFRDQLCFKGRKVAYEDFPKIVRSCDDIKPYVCCVEPLTGDDIVIDAGALLSAGVAEVVTMLSIERQTVAFNYLEYLWEFSVAEDWYEFLTKVGSIKDEPVADSGKLMLTEALRSSLIDYRFPLAKRLYATLEALRLLSPKSYCEAIIEGFKLSLSVCSMFMCDTCSANSASSVGIPPDEQSATTVYGSVVTQRLAKMGAVEYHPDNSDRVRKISDGRGLALSMLTMFILDLYNRFADFRGVVDVIPLKAAGSKRFARKLFDSCIGDDWVGRFIEKGHCRVTPCDTRMIQVAKECNILPVDCGVSFKQGSTGLERLGRGFREAQILWKYACGIKDIETRGVYDPAACTYATRVDICHACFDFVFSSRGVALSKKITSEYEQQLIDSAMEQMNMDKVLSLMREDITQQVSSDLVATQSELKTCKERVQSLETRNSDLEHALSAKNDIISELREELGSLTNRMRSIFSDEDYSEEDGDSGVVDTAVSPEEMLDFVNQFRLVVVGGRDNLQTKLEDLGFTNIFCIGSEHANNTIAFGDFFCICTKFVSHKLIYMVESKYSNQLDEFFYFNGTNVDAMLRTCYAFMHGYMESEGGDSDED